MDRVEDVDDLDSLTRLLAVSLYYRHLMTTGRL